MYNDEKMTSWLITFVLLFPYHIVDSTSDLNEVAYCDGQRGP
jgi:hypothetical protein